MMRYVDRGGLQRWMVSMLPPRLAIRADYAGLATGMLPPAQTGWQAQPPIRWPKEQLTASRFFGHMRTALKRGG